MIRVSKHVLMVPMTLGALWIATTLTLAQVEGARVRVDGMV